MKTQLNVKLQQEIVAFQAMLHKSHGCRLLQLVNKCVTLLERMLHTFATWVRV